LPKTYGKNPSDFGRSLEDILKEAKKLPKEKVGRKGTTLNRHLTQLKAVIEYIETSGNSIGDYRSVEKLRAKTETRARDARAVFTADNIRGFFQTAPWTGCAGETDRLKQGPVIIHDALYWVPILAKSTLGRREEICGLDVDDVGEFEGIPFVIFDYSKHRLLKNRQSIRRIPLLGEVTRLGFLQYLVVPNAAEEKKSFHSFRKTSGSDLKDAGIASELRADILGHGGKNITEERYASSAKLAQMLEALQRMPNYTADLVPRVVNLREDVIASRARASAKSRRLMRPQIGGS
jgi:integrase